MVVLKKYMYSACIAVAIAVAACGHRAGSGASAPPLTALDAAGRPVDVRASSSDAKITVVEFFSAHCPCQRVHDGRLRELYETYAPRGVRFIAIDAESGASPERAQKEASARGYPYPLLADPAGKTADALGAKVATHTVVLDAEGRIRYSGGIDSDRTHLTDDAKPWLKDAIDDLLAGRSPRVAEGKALGCALER